MITEQIGLPISQTIPFIYGQHTQDYIHSKTASNEPEPIETIAPLSQTIPFIYSEHTQDYIHSQTQLLQLQQPSIDVEKPGITTQSANETDEPGITTPSANENDKDDAGKPGITIVTSSPSIPITSNVPQNISDTNVQYSTNVPQNISDTNVQQNTDDPHITNVPQNIHDTNVQQNTDDSHITNVPQNIHHTYVPTNTDAPVTNIPTINVPSNTNEDETYNALSFYKIYCLYLLTLNEPFDPTLNAFEPTLNTYTYTCTLFGHYLDIIWTLFGHLHPCTNYTHSHFDSNHTSTFKRQSVAFKSNIFIFILVVIIISIIMCIYVFYYIINVYIIIYTFGTVKHRVNVRNDFIFIA